LEVERRAGGRLFHARGPAMANARSPLMRDGWWYHEIEGLRWTESTTCGTADRR